MPALSERPSNYLSSRSADVILSDVRPTKLKADALRAVNVFLDEVLWSILVASRSFSTERLKAGLLKLLPTSLGKGAVLEAEVELRAYRERTNSSDQVAAHRAGAEDPNFPLQAAFELLRLKCEAYSTLNDTDEDLEAEAKWQGKLWETGDYLSERLAEVAPAALYLTAILEHICERILSSTSRVTARDSSRTTATLQDLFTGLCEDDTVYGLFKTMKVFDQIEMQTKLSTRPRQSKSYSRQDAVISSARAGSPSNASAHSDTLVSNNSKSRVSFDSASSNAHSASSAAAQPPLPRTSVEKSKGKKMFGRASIDRDGAPAARPEFSTPHKRSGSTFSDANRTAITSFDDGSRADTLDSLEQDFDDLMRSGTTMKVSLTPDRLRSFEVHNKERAAKDKMGRPVRHPPSSSAAAIRTATSNRNDHFIAVDVPQLPEDIVSKGLENAHLSPARTRVRQDYIDEDDEDIRPLANHVQGRAQPKESSKTSVLPAPEARSPAPSPRNRSISAAPPPQIRPTVSRKASLSAVNSGISPPAVENGFTSVPRPSFVTPLEPKARPTPANRPKPLDLDDDAFGADFSSPNRKPPFTPKAARPNRGGSQDLIKFLEEGPPEPPSFLSSPGGSAQDSRLKQGRFRSMVSRLTRGGSTEKLSGQYGADEGLNGLRRITTTVPTPTPPSLNSKKSLGNINTRGVVTMVPPMPAAPQTPISPSSPSVDMSAFLPPRPRYTSTSRKAVPTWEKRDNQADDDKANGIIGAAEYEVHAPPRGASLKFSQSELKKVSTDSEDASDSPPSTPAKPSITPKASAQAKPVAAVVQTVMNGAPIETVSHQQPQTPISPRKKDPLPPLSTVVSSPSPDQVRDLRRLMARATTADECRLLLDMVLVQAGFKLDYDDIIAQPNTLEVSEEEQSSIAEVLLSAHSDTTLHNDEDAEFPNKSDATVSNSTTYVSLYSAGKSQPQDIDIPVMKEDNIISIGA